MSPTCRAPWVKSRPTAGPCMCRCSSSGRRQGLAAIENTTLHSSAIMMEYAIAVIRRRVLQRHYTEGAHAASVTSSPMFSPGISREDRRILEVDRAADLRHCGDTLDRRKPEVARSATGMEVLGKRPSSVLIASAELHHP